MESAYCWQLYFALYPRHSQTNTQRCWGKSKVICMKKAISILMCVLLSLTILYPAGVVITACFGYSFELISVSAFAIAIAALSVCIVILDLVCKNTLENNTIRILLAIITPLSLINAVFYIFKCSQFCVIVSVLLSTGCCCYLTVRYGKPLTLKVNCARLYGQHKKPPYAGIWNF